MYPYRVAALALRFMHVPPFPQSVLNLTLYYTAVQFCLLCSLWILNCLHSLVTWIQHHLHNFSPRMSVHILLSYIFFCWDILCLLQSPLLIPCPQFHLQLSYLSQYHVHLLHLLKGNPLSCCSFIHI